MQIREWGGLFCLENKGKTVEHVVFEQCSEEEYA